MVLARRSFLSQGFYAPLGDAIARAAATFAAVNDNPPVVVDCGCGEGYYLDQLHRAKGERAAYFGLDISKEAARMASKTHPTHGFLVADVNGVLPFNTEAASLLLNVFAPRNPTEYARILHPKGRLVVAIPAPEHLHELRRFLPIIGIEREKRRVVIEQFAPMLQLQSERTLSKIVRFDTEALIALLSMTPNYHHFSPLALTKARRISNIETTAAFTILVFGRA